MTNKYGLCRQSMTQQCLISESLSFIVVQKTHQWATLLHCVTSSFISMSVGAVVYLESIPPSPSCCSKYPLAYLKNTQFLLVCLMFDRSSVIYWTFFLANEALRLINACLQPRRERHTVTVCKHRANVCRWFRPRLTIYIIYIFLQWCTVAMLIL